VWNAATGEKISQLEGHSGVVMGIACHPKGDVIVSASADKTLIIWESFDFFCPPSRYLCPPFQKPLSLSTLFYVHNARSQLMPFGHIECADWRAGAWR